MAIETRLLLGVGVVWTVIIAWHLTLYRRILSRLIDMHPSVWRDLGAPVMTLSVTQGWKSGWATDRFLRHKHYLDLADDELNQLARRYRVVAVCEVGVMVVFVMLWFAFSM